jgi:hypothetical protein
LKPKSKIVIASVLKPVDDTRMFEKFGLTLGGSNLFDIHIVGFKPGRKLQNHPNIHYHPIYDFSRISLGRLLSPLKFFCFLLKVKPEVIMVNCTDLQMVMVVYKIIFGARAIYDVQENYFLNILHTDAFPGIVRPIAAALARSMEWLSSPFIDHFILAERVYSRQLPFIGSKFTVIENKYEPVLPLTPPIPVKIDPHETLKIVFTGTLAMHYGTLDAIWIANTLSKHVPIALTIIGRSADKGFLAHLKKLIAGEKHIRLVGGEHPVSHLEIIKAMRAADVGIMSYLPNKSTKGRIPTKLYEYVANRLPILVLHDQDWLHLAQKYGACISICKEFDAEVLLKELYSTTFYDNHLPIESLLWKSEREKLLKLLKSCIKI